MSKSSPPSPPTAGGGSSSASSTTQPCPCATKQIPPKEVSVTITQTISNAPPAYSAWNNTYSWQSKFTLAVDRPNCAVKATIKLNISGTITDDQKNAWKSAIEGKWNGQVKFVCPDPGCPQACPGGMPVSLEVLFVTSGGHYVVTANTPGATEGGRSGMGGTTSMTGWGINDTTDVTHEFGHMLGNVEEYFTTNGIDYTHGGVDPGFRAPSGHVMNNPANGPGANNYDVILKETQTAIGGGTKCTSAIQ